MRYIDADKFKRMYREQLNCVFLALQKSLGEAIDNVPTADVRENVRGEWVPCGGSFRCSECASMPEFKDIRRLHYCPNCGCDMRKVMKE